MEFVDPESDALTFDEALTKYVGEFGKAQWRQVALTSLFQLLNALAFMIPVFLFTGPIKNRSWECIDPKDALCKSVLAAADPSTQFCSLRPDAWRWTSQESLVSQLNLVCKDAWKVQLTNSIFFVGAFAGNGLFGVLCDRIGRKKPLFIATALVSASMLLSLVAPRYWLVAVLRAFTGMGAAGQSHTMFLLCTECTGPVYRGRASVASLLFFAVGEFLLVALAVGLPIWQHLTIAAGALNAAALLLYPFIDESARWLLSQGRQEEATHIMQLYAARNGSTMPARPLRCTRESIADPDGERSQCSCSSGRSSGGVKRSAGASSTAEAVGLMAVLKNRSLLIRSIILLITWYSLLQVYFGISLGAGGLPGSVYATFAMGVAAEIVALLVAGPSVDKFGRHTVVSLGLLLGGGACLACANIKGNIGQAVLAAIGKFGCSVGESVISIFTAELYPTSVRSTAMGIFYQAARIGCIAAPFMLMLGTQLRIVSPVFIPYMVFGSISCLAGVLVLVLPETLGADMPESLADMKQLQSIFSAQPWRQGCMGILAFVFRTRAANVRSRAAVGGTAHQQSSTKARGKQCEKQRGVCVTAICSELESDSFTHCKHADSRTKNQWSSSMCEATDAAARSSHHHEQAASCEATAATGAASAEHGADRSRAGAEMDEVIVTVVPKLQ